MEFGTQWMGCGLSSSSCFAAALCVLIAWSGGPSTRRQRAQAPIPRIGFSCVRHCLACASVVHDVHITRALSQASDPVGICIIPGQQPQAPATNKRPNMLLAPPPCRQPLRPTRHAWGICADQLLIVLRVVHTPPVERTVQIPKVAARGCFGTQVHRHSHLTPPARTNSQIQYQAALAQRGATSGRDACSPLNLARQIFVECGSAHPAPVLILGLAGVPPRDPSKVDHPDRHHNPARHSMCVLMNVHAQR
jgi:hypothetical protein